MIKVALVVATGSLHSPAPDWLEIIEVHQLERPIVIQAEVLEKEGSHGS